MYSNTKMQRFCIKTGRKWLSCLSIVLLLISLFPATVLGATATMAIDTFKVQVGPPPQVATPLTESIINSNDTVIKLTLTNNKWASNITDGSGGINPIWLPVLKNGFETTSDIQQWTNLLPSTQDKFKLTTSVVADDTIEITVPKSDANNYNIQSDQTVTFTPPVSLLEDSSNIPGPKSFTITADPQANFSGSLTTGATESKIASGGQQLIIKLVNRKWDPNVATYASKRVMLFGKLQASGLELSKWNNDVYNALIQAPDPSTVIKRNDDQTVTITLPKVPTYDITADQTVTLTSLDTTLLRDMDMSNSSVPSLTTNLTFTIKLDNISITPSAPLTESLIKNASNTLTLTLTGKKWATDIATNLTRQTALLNGFTTSTDIAAWDSIKTAIIPITNPPTPSDKFILTSPEILTITIPQKNDYSISTDQNVTIDVPSTVLDDNVAPSRTLSLTITADKDVSVSISGSLTAGVNEMDIVNGGKEITATLTNATWNSIDTDDMRKALINSLLPGFAESYQQIIEAGAIYTLSTPSTMTIKLPKVPGFNISDPLTITPRIAVTTNLINALGGYTYTESALTSFTIYPINNQSASISGTATTATESDLVTGGKTLLITLNNDVWAEDVVSNSVKLTALINSIENADTTNEVNNTAWTKVQTLLNASNVIRSKETELTINLPPVSAYSLDADQTINVIIPAGTLATSTNEITAGSFTIKAVTATLSGTAVTAPLESTSVVAGGKTIVITLKNATWASDVATAARLDDLLNCFVASPISSPVLNWGNIKKYIKPQNLTLSGSVLTIKLPPVPLALPEGWSVPPEQVRFMIDDSNDPYIFQKLIKESLSSGKTLTASPDISIGKTLQSPITASVSGSMLASDIVKENSNSKITVTLSNGIWNPLLLTDSTKFNALVSGFTVTTDSTNWALVQTALKNANLDPSTKPFKLTTNNVLEITLPVVPGYDPLKDQTVRLTIPKTVLVPATADVPATGSVTISLPNFIKLGTLQALLEDGSFANYINTVSLRKIYLDVPTKHLTSVVSKQSTIGNTTINSLDLCTDSSVESINVLVNGTDYPSSTSEPNGNGKKFNVGIAIVSTTTDSTLAPDAIISVLDGSGKKLQSDVTIKLGGSKTYSLAPTTDLSGNYSLYKLMNDKSLLDNILKPNAYVPADIIVKTAQ